MAFTINSLTTNTFYKQMHKSSKNKKSKTLDFNPTGTIRDMAKLKLASDNMQTKATNKDENIPTYDHKFTVCGIDFTDNPDGFKKIVPIPEEMRKKLDQFVKENFERQGYVKKDNLELTEKRIKTEQDFLKTLKQEDRPSMLWSMAQYGFNESKRFEAQIREKDPSWDWGRKVKTGVIEEVFSKNKIDIQI